MGNDRLAITLETFGFDEWARSQAEWLRDDLTKTFSPAASDALLAGLLGEHEPADAWGFRVRESDISGVTQSERMASRLAAYGRAWLVTTGQACWCDRFHMSPFTDLGHAVIAALRIPEFADWLESRVWGASEG